jgi:hypothetical protein
MSGDGDMVTGLTVHVRDGQRLGVVVGVFADGPLAGRLRLEGDEALGGHPAGLEHAIAVYAIPPGAVVRQLHDSLVLHTDLRAARSRWLMHVILMKGAS